MDELTLLCTVPPKDSSARYHQIQQTLQRLSVLLVSDPELSSSETLQTYLTTVLHPPYELLPIDECLKEGTGEPQTDPSAWNLFHEVSEKALEVLRASLSHTPAVVNSTSTPLPTIAVAIITYTDPTDPWTSTSTHQISSFLLNAHTQLSSPEALSRILQTHIKPLFKSSLTPAGRAPQRESTNKSPVLTQASTWPSRLPQTITLLSWIIRTLPKESLEDSWPLLIPPILSIHDSISPLHKTLASDLLSALLPRLPTTLLARTGLAPMLRDAVLPDLLLLPPLTPTRVSVPLLRASYTVLRVLANVSTADRRSRARQLDGVFRNGVVRGFTFAGENTIVAEELMRQVERLMMDMGVYAVRHLGDLVEIVGNVLTDPFVGVAGGLAVVTLKTLEVGVGVCWVRVCGYVPELLKTVTICYRMVSVRGEAGEVVGGLKKVVRVLRAVMAGENREEEMTELEKNIVEVDGRLAGLFDSG